jgi:hypothetical protein
MANVMLGVALVTVVPTASCTTTWTAGEIEAPAATALGCTVKASRAGTPGAPVRAALHVVLLLPEPQGCEKLTERVPDTAVAELKVPESV